MKIRRKAILSSLILGVAVTLSSGMASANQAPTSKSEQRGGIFTDDDRRIIRDFFDRLEGKDTDDKDHKGKGAKKGKKEGLPPGLAKRDELPPGLQKQLEKNGQLPPGLQKRALPDDLESRLSNLPKNLERIIVGEDILLIERGVGIILDIMKGGAK